MWSLIPGLGVSASHNLLQIPSHCQPALMPPVPGSRNIKALLLIFVNWCFFICSGDNIRHNALKCARWWDFRHQLTWVGALKTREDGNTGAVIDQMNTKRLFMSGCIDKYSHSEWLFPANESSGRCDLTNEEPSWCQAWQCKCNAQTVHAIINTNHKRLN